jgi:hypothetical protein
MMCQWIVNRAVHSPISRCPASLTRGGLAPTFHLSLGYQCHCAEYNRPSHERVNAGASVALMLSNIGKASLHEFSSQRTGTVRRAYSAAVLPQPQTGRQWCRTPSCAICRCLAVDDAALQTVLPLLLLPVLPVMLYLHQREHSGVQVRGQRRVGRRRRDWMPLHSLCIAAISSVSLS